jgi:predicted lipid-binding transport protein (Tim44 family)
MSNDFGDGGWKPNMWKKTLLLLSLFAFTLTFAAPLMEEADAKPRFSSGKRSFTTTPKKADDNVVRSDGSTGGQTGSTTGAATASRTGAGAGTAATKGGAFSGGGFLKGLMVGGLAGLLFGSLLGTGFFGQMFGLLINVLAIIALFMLARAVFVRIRNRRQPQSLDPRDRGV